MMRSNSIRIVLALAVAAMTGFAAAAPLKVYILAGQSNMQGSAHKRTFAAIGDDPESAPLLGEILDRNGEPVVCENAWITYLTGGRDGDKVLGGKVKVGYGFDGERIGPEYGFGIDMDRALDEPVLIIKTAWGGKSLAVDFRPPSAGPYAPSAMEKERGNFPAGERVGHYYREMIRFVRATLKDAESIRKVVPGYRAEQGYELAGFVWFQGWNDMCNRHHIAQYTDNMIHFITDVRKEFNAPALRFIVGILGVYGTDPDSRLFDKGLPVTAFRKAQFDAVAQYDLKAPEKYRGNVIAVDSGHYYDLGLSDIYWKRRLVGHWKRSVSQGKMTREKFKAECGRYGFGDGELTAEEKRTWDRCASNAEYHYLGSGKTFIRFGKALARAMRGGAPKLPNIVIVYTDDLGFGDLSIYNPKAAYKTPRIDRMAREGILFTDAHSPSTICSPSRYGLFSGQQIFRSTGRGGGAFEGPGGPSYLKPGTLTLGDMLRSRGYRTGIFGKWHVGLTWYDDSGKRLGGGFANSKLINYEKSTPLIDGPNNRGFDASFVTPNCPTTDPLYVYIENGMVDVPATVVHRRKNLPNLDGWLWDNDEGFMSVGYDFENADKIFYDKTVTFIEKHLRDHPEKPFFAVLSTQIAHAPVLPAEEFRGKTQGGPRGDFLWELDVLVGRLLDRLKALGVDENTLVLFNADNGAETVHYHRMLQEYDHDASGGWRGMKRDGWEGGHRVPFIARWPRAIPAGQVSKQMTNTTDIFATLASVVGYELKDEDATDSFDMLPVMLGLQKEDDPVRPHMLTQSFRGQFQIRQGPWKYLDHMGSGGNNYSGEFMSQYLLPEKAPEATGQLYHLGKDPGETTNLFFKEAGKRKELQGLLRKLKESGRSAPRGRKPLQMPSL